MVLESGGAGSGMQPMGSMRNVELNHKGSLTVRQDPYIHFLELDFDKS